MGENAPARIVRERRAIPDSNHDRNPFIPKRFVWWVVGVFRGMNGDEKAPARAMSNVARMACDATAHEIVI